jgi:peptide/nickel transport system permease protein
MAVVAVPPGKVVFAGTLRGLLRGRLGVGAVLFTVVVGTCLIGPLLWSYDPIEPTGDGSLTGSSAAHPFGTDQYGRDLLARVLEGGRVSLQVGVTVTVLTLLIGGALGLVAGYLMRIPDAIISRLVDTMLSVPGILLAIAVISVLGSGSFNVSIALTMAYVPEMARVVRGATISVRNQPHVRSARAVGSPASRVVLRHIVPFVAGPAIVQATFVLAYAILNESALSFLGIGVRAPDPSWGNIIADGRSFLTQEPFHVIFPGIAISLTVLAVNMIGDGLRDLLAPERMR